MSPRSRAPALIGIGTSAAVLFIFVGLLVCSREWPTAGKLLYALCRPVESAARRYTPGSWWFMGNTLLGLGIVATSAALWTALTGMTAWLAAITVNVLRRR